MKWILGVDGGQTSLKCALADDTGRVLGEGTGRGIRHLAAEGAEIIFQAALAEAVSAAWESAGLQPQRLHSAALGLTGVSDAATPEAVLARQLAARVIDCEHISVENDALIALKGAHLGQPGVIVIAGTGAIALGIDRQGNCARAGGWGWLLGDEGSAYWLGREAVRVALRAQEGWGPATTLQAVIQQHFDVDDLIAVKRAIFAPAFGSQGFAALAPLAAQAAAAGDAVAAGIFQQAGQELGALALAVDQRLGGSLPVAPVGGAFEHFSLLRHSFTSWLASANPELQVVAPQGTPVQGAVILAREAPGK